MKIRGTNYFTQPETSDTDEIIDFGSKTGCSELNNIARIEVFEQDGYGCPSPMTQPRSASMK
jgi:hypothetical protein